MNSPEKIIGIGGLPRSGKDTVADFVMNAGYFGVSLGDIVRDESRTRHAGKPDPISVANMTETSNWFRTQRGPDFAMKEALKRFDKASKDNNYQGLVVYSVRAPIEVDFILAQKGFLIWVDTKDEVRLERSNANLRSGETPLTLENMKSQEALQSRPQPELPAEVQMDTSYVRKHANIFIKNNGDDLKKLRKHAEKILENKGIFNA
jgi:dephospho-CoA kinase